MRRKICKWLIDHGHKDLAVKLFPNIWKDIFVERIDKILEKMADDWFEKENLGGS